MRCFANFIEVTYRPYSIHAYHLKRQEGQEYQAQKDIQKVQNKLYRTLEGMHWEPDGMGEIGKYVF